MAISFVCFLHCLLVILVFLGAMSSNIFFISFFEVESNHAALIISSFIFAALSQTQIKTKQLDGLHKKTITWKFLSHSGLIAAGGLLGLSFFISDIYSEMLVILGASILLSMHAEKLMKGR